HALSRMIHFYPLNPRMCQLGVRNVGKNRQSQKPAPADVLCAIDPTWYEAAFKRDLVSVNRQPLTVNR
ncbi:hypothetical protein QUB10_27670, partial [Microcoleus sp. B5-D4]|uniref:hypothetical protein n=1 Tax=unclassified Microcoleus TaxID=2642155 RepID=UPI002FD3DCCF